MLLKCRYWRRYELCGDAIPFVPFSTKICWFGAMPSGIESTNVFPVCSLSDDILKLSFNYDVNNLQTQMWTEKCMCNYPGLYDGLVYDIWVDEGLNFSIISMKNDDIWNVNSVLECPWCDLTGLNTLTITGEVELMFFSIIVIMRFSTIWSGYRRNVISLRILIARSSNWVRWIAKTHIIMIKSIFGT